MQYIMKTSLPTSLYLISLIGGSLLLTQPATAGKFKCWTNSEGVKECGSFVPPEYSQQRIETRNSSGRVIEIKERAKTKEELEEIARQKKLAEIEAAKRAEQKKKDDILLKTFTRERDINMLRDSKVSVIEGIITVTKSNNKTLNKKLQKLQRRAANVERRGKKPPQRLLDDIASIEKQIARNKELIKQKRQEQEMIRAKFNKQLERFRYLMQERKKNAKK